jgi:hypothetical protein
MAANNKKKVTIDLTGINEANADAFLGELDTLLGTYSLSRDNAEPAFTEYAGNAGIYEQIGSGKNKLLLACDHACDKAWGVSTREQTANEFHSDSELGTAPADPGSESRGQKKPVHLFERLNRWCQNECERCVQVSFWTDGTPPTFPDFSARVPVP